MIEWESGEDWRPSSNRVLASISDRWQAVGRCGVPPVPRVYHLMVAPQRGWQIVFGKECLVSSVFWWRKKKKLVRLACFGNFVNSRLIKGWILLHWPNKGMLWIKGYLSVWVLQWTVMRVWIQGARPPQIQLSVAHARQFRGRWRCAHWQRVWQTQNGLWLGLEDVCKKCLVHRHLVVLGYESMLTGDEME